MAYWLAKTEPSTFSWQDLVARKQDVWDGVRNHQAANYLAAMKPGDQVMIYHSGRERAIVGVAEVVSDPYPDPTAADDRWLTVDMAACHALPLPVSLKTIKDDERFSQWALVRQSRLSVMPVPDDLWEAILAMES